MFDSGRLRAQLIAEAERIPRSRWADHLVSFSDIRSRMAPARFNGRIIAVARR